MKNKKITPINKISSKNRKLILTDLDGTLLNNDSEVSDYTVKTVKEIVKKGHIFCIATGRPWRSSEIVYRQLGINTIIANLNGSILTNPTDENFLPINLTFSKEIIKDILSTKEIKKYLGTILVENYDGAFLISTEKNEDVNYEFLKKFHINKETNFVQINQNELDVIKKDLNSILIHLKDKNKIDLLSFKIKSITDTLVVRTWSLPHDAEGTVIEINSIFSNKGTTLKFLSSYYAIPLHNCYAFGDGENDLEMIRTILNGYALKNSSHVIKLSSHRITKYDNENHGVAKELSKIFKLKNNNSK